MKYLIVLVLTSIAAGAKLDKVYLPPNAQASSGVSAGLQAPFSGQTNQPSQGSYSARASAGSNSNAEILRYENEIDENGFHYAYETSDGTKAEQQGRVLPGSAPEEGSLQVSGSFSYIGDDGQTYSVSYTADENGYHAEGAHLPTPPPIPEAILKSLQLTDSGRNQYDSKKSSYDADAGY
ncbi:hypothetical protein ACJJTC_009779 [Scirpophaga incertulas]